MADGFTMKDGHVSLEETWTYAQGTDRDIIPVEELPLQAPNNWEGSCPAIEPTGRQCSRDVGHAGFHRKLGREAREKHLGDMPEGSKYICANWEDGDFD